MLTALGFLTIVGRSQTPNRSTLAWFPVVGVAIGAAIAGTHWAAHELWSPLVAGAVVVAVDLVLTGALHLDGLADSADGLLPHLDRERRLQVMAEPTVGAFAAVAIAVVLMLRWSSLAHPGLEPMAVVALWAGSRTAAGAIPAFLSYARPGGLAAAFLGRHRAWPAAALLPAAVAIVLAAQWRGAAGVVAATVAVLALAAVARGRLGGFTGDVLGAVIIVAETIALLALVASR